jgi:FKBP-type peptidyl-prolyl cis-trans isomerase SlyD
MEIADRRVATVHFTLTDDSGNTLASTQGHAPLLHLQGGGGIIPALEQALEGRKAGDRFEVTVDPQRGFGPHHPELVQTLPRSAFNGTTAPVVGSRLRAQTARGPLDVVVTSVDEDSIGVDGNHPLAGKTFRLDVEVVDVRLATPEEIQFGVK